MDKSQGRAYALRAREEYKGKPHQGLWTGFSVFQVPDGILQYKGDPTAHVALLLYQLGAGVSNREMMDHFDVSFKVRASTLARNIGRPERTVTRALEQLKLDGMIYASRTGHTSLGRFSANRITLLDQQTRRPLQTTGSFGLLSGNKIDHFITVPKASLADLRAMKYNRERAAYLSALALVSRELNEIVAASKHDWRKVSRLGRNPFVSGRKYCITKKLVSHGGGVLVANDPLTGKPTQRWRNEKIRTYHENARWKFNLNEISSAEWQKVVETMLGQEFHGDTDGWMAPTEGLCPFCRHEKGDGFAVNFAEQCFKCHKCGDGGKLGKFVQRVRGTSMEDAKKYIQEVIAKSEQVSI